MLSLARRSSAVASQPMIDWQRKAHGGKRWVNVIDEVVPWRIREVLREGDEWIAHVTVTDREGCSESYRIRPGEPLAGNSPKYGQRRRRLVLVKDG